LHQHLQRALDEIDSATAGMTDEELARHRPGKWSSAEILEHLSIAYAGTAAALDKRLAEGAPRVKPTKLWQRIGTTIVAHWGFFPSGGRAPAGTWPTGLPPAEALRAAREGLAVADRALEECARRFGADLKVSNHPILGAFTVNEWRKFHWVHTHHHVKQIKHLRG
jgi:hypothetical protein